MLSLLPHTPDDVLARLAGGEPPLPRRADAIVIGGGIIGLAAAYFLARQGLRPVVLEQGRAGAQQSSRNWGFVRALYRDPLEVPLAAAAMALWPALEAELGAPMGWRRRGCLFTAAGEAEREAYRDWLGTVGALLPEARLLSGPEVATRWPRLQQLGAGALFSPTDGQAEPLLACLAFRDAALRHGARLIEDGPVLGIETQGGRVCGVRTDHGVIASNIVVCAAGAASRDLLGGIGLGLPQQVVRSTACLTAPLEALMGACFCGFGLGLRQRADGSCILATDGEADVELRWSLVGDARHYLPGYLRHRRQIRFRPAWGRLRPDARRVRQAAAGLQRLFGLPEPVRVVKAWAGRIDLLPDALPVIDAPPERPGLLVATGFSGHGFGLAPAVGQGLARLAAGLGAPPLLAPFRLDRFRTGRAGPAFGPP